MPRRVSDYPDAFTGWNFISSIGSVISVAATALFLQIVYLQLVKGKAIYGYIWAVPQLFSDYYRILTDRCSPGLEWALHNPPKPHAFTSLPLQSMDPIGMIAEQAHLAASADCLHPLRAYVTVTTQEIIKGLYPLCDFNPTNGRQHSVIGTNLTFGFCTNCHMVMCAKCNLAVSQASVSQASVLFLTSFSIFPTLLSNIKKYFLSVFVKYRSVTPYIFIGLCSLFILFFSFDLSVISCDAPRAWGLYFQDSASPQMEALVELHDDIMYYLVAILFSVAWIQGAIIKYFNSAKYPISNKYLNHGINVPTQKYSKFSGINPLNHKVLFLVRTYSTSTYKEQDKYNTQQSNVHKDSINPLVYVNAYSMKKTIIKENTGKSGIYMWTNLLTGDMYIGQSKDLSKRFSKYFTISYIKSKEELIMSRALIKYGYANFSVSILEYCDKCDLTVREQFYLDIFNPQYNILKIAGSSLGYKRSEETKLKISKALKGIYTGDKSALFGRFHTEETKKLMSLSKAGENNPLYGKTHSEDTKELMRQRALNRKHSCETKDRMSKTHGNPVNIYEQCSSKGFELIGSFVSARRAAKFLGISGSTVIRYMQSGGIFKDRYKFSSK